MIFYLPVAHDLSILRPVILIWRTFHEICKQGHLGVAYKGGGGNLEVKGTGTVYGRREKRWLEAGFLRRQEPKGKEKINFCNIT